MIIISSVTNLSSFIAAVLTSCSNKDAFTSSFRRGHGLHAHHEDSEEQHHDVGR